jgi:hypothetical protein
MKHVRFLATTIGPRDSTTPQEKEGARYAALVRGKVNRNPVEDKVTGQGLLAVAG